MKFKTRGGYEELEVGETLRLMARDNGWLWTTVFVAEYLLEGGVGRITRWRNRYEESRNIPGSNSVALNLEKWDKWDWSQAGEEWTESAEWKQAVVDEIMKANLGDASSILEIGPGAGRWTEYLKDVADHLTVVDLSPACIDLCRERFSDADNIDYAVTTGTDLGFMSPESVDGVWSFDVFMHIAPMDTAEYLRQIARVLRPGGVGVIHHARAIGWHNRVGAREFAVMVEDAGLTPDRQFDSFGPNDEFNFDFNSATVTIFHRPES